MAIAPALAALPNPFNPKTSIALDLAGASSTELAVFDAAGRRVRTLLSGETLRVTLLK